MTTGTTTKTTKKFDANISRVLNIVINSIYTNRDIFLRELISNASDACDKLKYLSTKDQSLIGEGHNFKIEIKCSSETDKEKFITIKDHGIGMDEKDIVENLGTIASSGTSKFAQMIKEGGEASSLIGQFGVGFYSAFMISSLVSVKTKKAGSQDVFLWVSNGTSEYTIEKIADNNFTTGTEITLYLKPEDGEKYTDKFAIERIIKTYSNHIQYPIEFEHEKDMIKTINNAKAIWLRDRKDITEEEYKEFYRQSATMADEPFFIIHNKVEGALEYSNLLFIPSKKPFDLYAPDRKASVKLYANRVFITENSTEILPEYLRFVKGVVDSPDLPLNISRETFQKNEQINKIRSSLIKKIFTELKRKQEADVDKYAKFWENFSNVIKEGLCDYASDKEQIMDICLFHTTKSGDNYVTMDEYITNMKPEQQYIYYITGEDHKDLANNPQLEAFKKQDIEVLLLTDAVDDFWVNVVIDSKGKDLKSITSKDVKADESFEQNEETHKDLTELFKAVLGGKIKDVKTTDKLVDSPACLSTEHGAMTIRMEKYLFEQKQLPKMSAKILELNPHHPLVVSIFNRYVAAGKPTIHAHENGELHFHGDETEQQNTTNFTQKDLDLISIIYDLACLTGGDFVPAPNDFAKRVMGMLG